MATIHKMYSNQGSKTVELFTAQGRDPLAKVRLIGGRTIKKEFDSVIKGYVLSLNGSPATSRVHLPKAERKGMGLVHPFLMFQIFLPQDSRTQIELTILDTTNCKQKLQFLSWQKEVSFSPLVVKLPLPIPTNEWQWLIIDLLQIVPHLFTQSFQSLETIAVCGSCKIRLISTLRDMITCNSDLPSSWQPPPSTPPLNFTVLNSEVYSKSDGSHQQQVQKGEGRRGGGGTDKHVAFGEKIPIPEHIKNSSNLIKNKPNSREKRVIQQYTEVEGLVPEPLQQGLIPEPSQPRLIPEPLQQGLIPEPLQQGLIPELSQQGLIPEPSQQGLIPDPSQQGLIPESQRLKTPQLFAYVSPPHSTSSSLTHSGSIKTHTQTTSRKETLDEDFLSISAVRVHETATTTNEDYDWKRYHSDSTSNSDDENLSPSSPPSPSSSHQIIPSNKLTNDSSSLHDSIDISGMGGATTPCDSTYFPPQTDQSDTSISHNDDISNKNEDDKNLELLYDPDLNYFYDPKTGKCYELTH